MWVDDDEEGSNHSAHLVPRRRPDLYVVSGPSNQPGEHNQFAKLRGQLNLHPILAPLILQLACATKESGHKAHESLNPIAN
jgi:hypothetical protein